MMMNAFVTTHHTIKYIGFERTMRDQKLADSTTQLLHDKKSETKKKK